MSCSSSSIYKVCIWKCYLLSDVSHPINLNAGPFLGRVTSFWPWAMKEMVNISDDLGSHPGIE